MKKFVPFLLAMIALLSFMLPVSAAEGDYTYTVRIYAGAQGTIDGQDLIVVDGLRHGDRVDFSIGSVVVANDSKYYVKGIRESGKDNNTVSANSIFVEEDVDYVVAYGLKGSSVAYTVNFVDEDGAEIYPSVTYYGNVGDKPVVSYQYIEGYQSQAYNVTKTLAEDPAENVFTFTYTRTGETAAAPGTDGGAGTGENAPAVVRPVEDVPDNQTPEANPNGENNGPEEIEDQDVPLANPVEQIAKVLADAAALPLGKKMLIGGCVLVGFALLMWLIFGRKRDKEEFSEKRG